MFRRCVNICDTGTMCLHNMMIVASRDAAKLTNSLDTNSVPSVGDWLKDKPDSFPINRASVNKSVCFDCHSLSNNELITLWGSNFDCGIAGVSCFVVAEVTNFGASVTDLSASAELISELKVGDSEGSQSLMALWRSLSADCVVSRKAESVSENFAACEVRSR